MRYKYCPQCGEKLIPKVIGDEGEVPYCLCCERPWFDCFSTCVLCVLVNDEGRVLLIRQSYGDVSRFVGVAGFMKPYESAEAAAIREIAEETGLEAKELRFLESVFYNEREQLMIGFLAYVNEGALKLSGEVSEGRWFDIDTAVKTVRESSIIQRLIIKAREILK